MITKTLADYALELKLSIATLVDLLRFAGVKVNSGASKITEKDEIKLHQYLEELNGAKLVSKIILQRDKNGFSKFKDNSENKRVLESSGTENQRNSVKCSNCEGNGKYESICPTCGGTSEVTEYVDTFRMARCNNMSPHCPFCAGTGVTRQKIISPMRVLCKKCKNGKIMVKCMRCQGSGFVYKRRRNA